MRRAIVIFAVLAAAGCGGTAQQTAAKQPRLPRALARSWQQQADSVAAALAGGDGCTAQQLATSLRASVLAAVDAGRVPRRLQGPLTSGVNDLTSRISCTPPAPAPVQVPEKHEHKPKHGKGHGND